ncbi:twin-arginine translocase subunit TatC [Pseudodesulfovibrio sediminis]|uniref:Sec-independent protein translocase protein TatC n=1 Tax=Pseudodesulfovibrio sediminis TaxID=2810563 RepID=A0ABN6EYQ1_9BACT|nr:twin-arginine translocase subunit TatC [Pseudodesulfovibrio sediminis]BCS90159.1 hypothetical protein PSDVSF_34010 [Pseudodesulfovibrio sediminis]
MSSEKDDVKVTPDEEQTVDSSSASQIDPDDDPSLMDADIPVVSEEELAQAEENMAEAGSGGGGGDTPVDGSVPVLDDDDPQEDDGSNDDEEESEDEGEGAQMSLLDHLGELRSRLMRSFFAVVVGMLACYSYAEQMFDILMAPMIEVFKEQAANNPLLTQAFYDDFGRVLTEMLADKGFQHTEQIQVFMDALQQALMQVAQSGHFQYTYPAEAFFSHIKIAIVAGIFLVSPYIFAQIWGFIAPGLYAHERKWMVPMAIISAVFFTSGALFGYFVVFPFGFEFFAGFSTAGIAFTPKLNEYLSFCLKLLFAFGFVFELPLFIFFLARLGIVSSKGLRRKRKYAILTGFILAAILTPPDPFTQCLMAGPLILLYELGIWLAFFFGKKEKRHLKKQEEEEARLQAERDAVAEEAETDDQAESEKEKA